MSDSLLIPFLDVYVTWSLIAFLPLVHLELLTVLKCGIEHRETNLCLLSWEPISLHCIDTLKEGAYTEFKICHIQRKQEMARVHESW